MNRHEQALLKAQSTVEKNKKFVKRYAKKRQWYHFMPECGWMNDPNGLIYYKGKYHLFYQFYPYGPYWSAMHWGHAISDDLLNWEYLPVALAPSEPYDDCQKGGIFSGSAVTGKDGRLYLFYTGTVISDDKVIKSQCMAVSEDGINFTKYQNNPIIDPTMFVESDPKVWYKENKWYMIVGGEENHKGRAILYVSDDLEKWSYFGTILKSDGSLGAMWECPDFYQLGDKYVLTFSPMGSGDHTSVYLTGDFDYKTGKFDWHISGEMDWGFDFYAPQSMVAPDGRRLIVAWANEWEWMPLFKDWGPTYQEGWCGFFNVIREVRMCKDGTLAFVPVEEMEKIRENKFTQREIQVTEKPQQLKAGDGISFEMKFTLDLEETDEDRVELKLRCGKEKETRCIFNLKNGELLVDRSCADGWSVGTSRSVLKVSEKSLDVHIFSDQSSLEIFTDQYRNNHSNNIFAGNDQEFHGLSYRS